MTRPDGRLRPEQRPSCITALDAAVEIVPMVEQAPFQPRASDDIDRRQRLAGLNQAEDPEGAVERAAFAERRDYGRRLSVQAGRTDHITLVSRACERVTPLESGDQR